MQAQCCLHHMGSGNDFAKGPAPSWDLPQVCVWGGGGRSAPERQQGELLPVVQGTAFLSRRGTRRNALPFRLPPWTLILLFTHRMCKDPGAGGSDQGLPPRCLQLCGLGGSPFWLPGQPLVGVYNCRLGTPPIPPSPCCWLGGEGQRLHQALGPCPTFCLGHQRAVCF